jgi:hypothetical protein
MGLILNSPDASDIVCCVLSPNSPCNRSQLQPSLTINLIAIETNLYSSKMPESPPDPPTACYPLPSTVPSAPLSILHCEPTTNPTIKDVCPELSYAWKCGTCSHITLGKTRGAQCMMCRDLHLTRHEVMLNPYELEEALRLLGPHTPPEGEEVGAALENFSPHNQKTSSKFHICKK